MLAKTVPIEGGATSLISCILSNYRIILAYEYNPNLFLKWLIFISWLETS